MLTDKDIAERIAAGEAAVRGVAPLQPEPEEDKTFRALTEEFNDLITAFKRMNRACPEIFEFSLDKGADAGMYINMKFHRGASVALHVLQIFPDGRFIKDGMAIPYFEYGGRDGLIGEVIQSVSRAVKWAEASSAPPPREPRRTRPVVPPIHLKNKL